MCDTISLTGTLLEDNNKKYIDIMGYKLFLEWTASVMMLRQLRQSGSIITLIYRWVADFADKSLAYSSAKNF